MATQDDGWSWTLAALDRFFGTCAGRSVPPTWRTLLDEPLLSLRRSDLPSSMLDANAGYLAGTATLARRTAAMHLDLARADDTPCPRHVRRRGIELWAGEMQERARHVLDRLGQGEGERPDRTNDLATAVLASRERLLARYAEFGRTRMSVRLSRIHGDYHLGQVVRAGEDFAIRDSGNSRSRSSPECHCLGPPLKDVACMLRSFSYAVSVARAAFGGAHPAEAASARRWAALWETCVDTVFLETYRASAAGSRLIPERSSDLGQLLVPFLLDRAFCELEYELDNRPTWLSIPLAAIVATCFDSEGQPRFLLR